MRMCLWCVFLLCSTVAYAQTSSEKKTTQKVSETEASKITSLPVKKVVLYKNGVGYFEHSGRGWGRDEAGPPEGGRYAGFACGRYRRGRGGGKGVKTTVTA